MRHPQIHFDRIMRTYPEGKTLYEMVKKSHQDLSLKSLEDGRISGFLYNIGESSVRASFYSMLLYDRFGQHSYVVGPKVQDLFRRTDLAKITPSMVTPPVSGFYVALPDCPWRIWGGNRTGWHPLRGVYVGFTKAADNERTALSNTPENWERTLHVTLWGPPNEKSVTHTDDAMIWYSMSLDAWEKEGTDLEDYFSRQGIMLADEKDAQTWSGRDPLGESETPTVPQKEDVTEHRHTLMSTMRVVFNLCLYLQTERPDLDSIDVQSEKDALRKEILRKKSAGKRKVLERRLANLPKTKIVYVGPSFEDTASETTSKRSSSTREVEGSPIEHAVRPHWQRYWVGQGENRRERWTLKGMYTRGSGLPDKTITKLRETLQFKT